MDYFLKLTLCRMWNRGFKRVNRENSLGFLFQTLYTSCFCSYLLIECSVVPKQVTITYRNTFSSMKISNVQCIEFYDKIYYFIDSRTTWKILNLKVLWGNHAYKKLYSDKKVQICAEIIRIYICVCVCVCICVYICIYTSYVYIRYYRSSEKKSSLEKMTNNGESNMR